MSPARPRNTAERRSPRTSARPARARTPDAEAQPLATRERVLEAAHAMIRQRGNAALSLVEVAEATQLSRQALYLLFGSRAGLLMALVDHLDAASAGPGRLAAMQQQHPADFEPFVRAWFDYLPVVLPVARALSAAAISGDEDARSAWHSRLRKLRRGFKAIASSMAAGGTLRAGWTPDTAADWMLALTHVDLWQQLVVDSGWRPEDHVTRIVTTLRATLLRQ